MAGRQRAIRADFEARRDLALMTSYFAGQMANADWAGRKVPVFSDWLATMTRPKPQNTAADRAAAFEALAARGYAVTVTRRPRNPAPLQKP